jgi:hypothetical protein
VLAYSLVYTLSITACCAPSTVCDSLSQPQRQHSTISLRCAQIECTITAHLIRIQQLNNPIIVFQLFTLCFHKFTASVGTNGF